jgi:hypothetical protein
MVIYNTSALEMATNPYSMATEINTLSGGLFAGFLLIVVSLFLIVIFRNTGEFKSVILGVSFMVTLFAVLLWAIQWIGIHILLFPLVVLMFSVIINIWGG